MWEKAKIKAPERNYLREMPFSSDYSGTDLFAKVRYQVKSFAVSRIHDLLKTQELWKFKIILRSYLGVILNPTLNPNNLFKL